MNQITSFEQACTVLGIDTTVPDFSFAPEEHRPALIAHYKLVIIAQALNGDWEPNWDDFDENKYYPWFDMEKSESNPGGFELNCVLCNYSASAVSSRLCFKSRDLAKHAATQFIDLYKEYMVISK